MKTITFTDMQIIDVRVGTIALATELDGNENFQKFKEHLNKFWIRLETCIDLQLMGRDFYLKSTSQVTEQVPELIETLNECIHKMGFNKCSISW